MTSPDLGRPRPELVFSFDEPPELDRSQWSSILGGKGAGLARMTALGLPVPPGFTIPTAVCNRVLESGWFDELDAAIADGLTALQTTLRRRLGDSEEPLLLSVRSGAPVSMPGMMDTVLNVGMTDEVAAALCQLSGDDRFGWDTYRRFLESYGTIVAGADADTLRTMWARASGGVALIEVADHDLPAILGRWRTLLADAGHAIPERPEDQILAAVRAVFESWGSDRAVVYRRQEGIAADLGTAATVQAMVFGNMGSQSGTGVAFTRDPSTGEAGLMGDFLVCAQGEDVVAGTHNTRPIAEFGEHWPGLSDQLRAIGTTLEHDLGDMVDIEFTVERGQLWLLQARPGKRSARAAFRVAVAMAQDPDFPLDRGGAIERVAHLMDSPPTEVSKPTADEAKVLAEGLAASPGRAVGIVCLSPDTAVALEAEGHDVVLIRPETSPADVHGMAAARGLVTTLGGLVSHAAVVARAWGLPAIVGAEGIELGVDAIIAGGVRVASGSTVTVDGDHGRLLLGDHPGDGDELAEVAIVRSWQAEAGQTSSPDDDPDESAPEDRAGEAATEISAEEARRALTLKGMATAEGIAEFAGVTVDATAVVLNELADSGQVQSVAGDRYMLTPDGTAEVEAAYAAEALTATPAIEPHLTRFHELNDRFKQVVTDWQMREVDGELVMNDHDDADYDNMVLDALTVEVHDGICAIIEAIAEVVPRLGVYTTRLAAAVEGIRGGDNQMVAHPLKASYHTVWFELHEELIRLSGRNRADEAAAGRA